MFKETSRNLGVTVSEGSDLERKIAVPYTSEIVSEIRFMISARRSGFIASGSESSSSIVSTYLVMSSFIGFIRRNHAPPGKYFSISTPIWGRPVKKNRIPGNDSETACNERSSLDRCLPWSSSKASIQIKAWSNRERTAFRSSRASGTLSPRPPTWPFAF